ncbi:MAG: bifunctional phosphopantothenoylcysteine decarboxylase/phosphopantothenate--cysteine ligase CoaBC [Bacteroidota bacterium]
MLAGKKILLAVSGSIAAYKSALLVRLLVKAQAEVQVIMSEPASEFITPLTLSTLSKNPVHIDFVRDKSGTWNNHVDLGLWADLMVVAPATSNTLAKCAQGLCDNLLTAAYLSAKCPVFFAPAMDRDMYLHPATQNNLRLLKSYGNTIIPSGEGELASGLEGQGRMAEPEEIMEWIQQYFAQTEESFLQGKKVLVTAGPTQEAIDPVRFISNHSSGKMGYALAEQAAEWGAEVYLVSGPSHLDISHPRIQKIPVRSAQEMFEASQEVFPSCDLAVLSAAVADFTPIEVASQKIKKQAGQDGMQIELKRTVDIAQTLGEQKGEQQLLLGFALETQNELENAQRKLKKKNFDLIVLNSLQDKGAGFGHDTNKSTLIDRQDNIEPLPLQSKKELARDILNALKKFL